MSSASASNACISLVRIGFIVALCIFLHDPSNFSKEVSESYLDFLIKGSIAILPISIGAGLVMVCGAACVPHSWVCLFMAPFTLISITIFLEAFYIAVAVFMHDDSNFNPAHVNDVYRMCLYVTSIVVACLDGLVSCITIPVMLGVMCAGGELPL